MPLSDSVQDVLDRARNVYLNDTTAATYTNTILLPYAKQAYDDLEGEIERNNLALKNGIAVITVPKLPNGLILAVPGNFLYPIELRERNLGSVLESDYSTMSQRDFEPTRDPTDRLINWTYREGTVHFVGATTDRQVKLFYQESYPSLKDGTSLVRGDCLAFLASRVAGYAHLFIAQNETLAKVASDISERQLDGIILTNVKRTQSLGVRRRPYRPFAR